MANELPLLRESSLSQEKDSEGGLRLARWVFALRRHLFVVLGTTALMAGAGIVKTVTDEPVYQAEFELSTPPITLETQIISSINSDVPSNQTEIVDAGLLDETKLKILTSPRVLEPVVKELQKRYSDITYTEVFGNLTITPNTNGKILTVQYKDNASQEVTDALNLISAAYLKYSLTDQKNNVDRGIEFVDQQLPAIRSRVNELESKLEQLRQTSNLIDPLSQGQQLSQQAAELKAEQLALKMQIEQTNKTYQALQQELDQGGELSATSALIQSERYQALINQMLAIDSQLADYLTVYLEGTPEIETLKEQQANLKPLLDREGVRVKEQVAGFIRDLEVRDQALSNSISVLNGQVNNLSTVTRQYNTIQRELNIADANLNDFLAKREALRIDAAQQRTPWEILTKPSEPVASSDKAELNLILGSLLGLLLGSGIALLSDRWSNKIHTVEELKEATSVSILGTIPYNWQLEKGQLPVFAETHPLDQKKFNIVRSFESRGFLQNHSNHSSASFPESFKRLAANIRWSNLDLSIRSLAVSSAISGDGKSTVSYYLAQSFAVMGQRTLLVDTDLRRPSLHLFSELSNERGLSNYISGEFELEDVIVNLPVDEHLFLVPSGPIPPEPAKILSARRMEIFLQRVYADFDIVIFDTPPLLGFADAFLVTKRTQGLLLTTRLGHLRFPQLQSVLDELQTAKTPILGLVANAASSNGKAYYNYQTDYQQQLLEDSGFVEPMNHLN